MLLRLLDGFRTGASAAISFWCQIRGPAEVTEGKESAGESFPLAHADYSPGSIPRMIEENINSNPDWWGKDIIAVRKAFEDKDSRLAMMAVWIPFHTVYQDPLAMCLRSSLDQKRDTFEHAVFDYQGRRYVSHRPNYRPGHKWVYLSEQTNEEALLFSHYDRFGKYGMGTVHASFSDPRYMDLPPRKSMDVRVLVVLPKSFDDDVRVH